MFVLLLLFASLVNATMIVVPPLIDAPSLRLIEEPVANETMPCSCEDYEWVPVPYIRHFPRPVPIFGDYMMRNVDWNDFYLGAHVDAFRRMQQYPPNDDGNREWMANTLMCRGREALYQRTGINYTWADCTEDFRNFIIECTPSRGHFMTSRGDGFHFD